MFEMYSPDSETMAYSIAPEVLGRPAAGRWHERNADINLGFDKGVAFDKEEEYIKPMLSGREEYYPAKPMSHHADGDVGPRSSKYENPCGLNPSDSWRMQTNAELEEETRIMWEAVLHVSGYTVVCLAARSRPPWSPPLPAQQKKPNLTAKLSTASSFVPHAGCKEPRWHLVRNLGDGSDTSYSAQALAAEFEAGTLRIGRATDRRGLQLPCLLTAAAHDFIVQCLQNWQDFNQRVCAHICHISIKSSEVVAIAISTAISCACNAHPHLDVF